MEIIGKYIDLDNITKARRMGNTFEVNIHLPSGNSYEISSWEIMSKIEEAFNVPADQLEPTVFRLIRYDDGAMRMMSEFKLEEEIENVQADS